MGSPTKVATVPPTSEIEPMARRYVQTGRWAKAAGEWLRRRAAATVTEAPPTTKNGRLSIHAGRSGAVGPDGVREALGGLDRPFIVPLEGKGLRRSHRRR